jgi:1-acyl-sn-glycerol-3-phosphate acyltransferase
VALERLEAVAASPENLLTTRRNRLWAQPLAHALMRAKGVKVTCEGWSNVPRRGPALMLANHAGYFDPVQLITQGRRTVHFMTTQGTMQDPALGRVMQWFGAVPKRKGVADPSAIRALRQWVKIGGLVGIFPEGERTWDGQPIPMLPGIERLVRVLKVPVVTARIHNADRVTPRWSRGRRAGRVHIEFDAPHEFAPKTSTDRIRSWITSRIAPDVQTLRRFPVRGLDIAAGLTNLIYACPACGHVEGLSESGDVVRCVRCGRQWTVTTTNELIGGSDGGPIWDVARRVDTRAEERWLDQAAGANDILVARDVSVLEATGDQGRKLATGAMKLSSTQLTVADWTLDLSSIGSTPIDLDRRLQVITKRGVIFEFEIPRGSVLKWKRAMDALRRPR